MHGRRIFSNPVTIMGMFTMYICMYIHMYNNFVVDGRWSSWRYGLCSRTCGRGIQALTRKCDNPVPSCGGNNCPGLSVDTTPCNIHCCPSKIITKLEYDDCYIF